jgi:hypothetical protein
MNKKLGFPFFLSFYRSTSTARSNRSNRSAPTAAAPSAAPQQKIKQKSR